jgi:hypothetical protein
LTLELIPVRIAAALVKLTQVPVAHDNERDTREETNDAHEDLDPLPELCLFEKFLDMMSHHLIFSLAFFLLIFTLWIFWMR